MTDDTVTPAVNDRRSTSSPREVAQHWATAMSDRDVGALRDLYEVGAALHSAEAIVLGQEQVADALLAMAPMPDAEPTIETGGQGTTTLTWSLPDDDHAASTRLRVRHGKIVEQWVGELHTGTGRLAGLPMDMETSGEVSAEEYDVVWDMIDKVVSLRDETASHVDVRLSQHPEQRGPDTVELRVNVTLPGASVRASARSGDVPSAALIVERKLRHALRRRADRRTDANQQNAGELPDGTTRPGGESARPRSEREIVRHKTVSPAPSTLEEATFDLESMGYDFFLYVDLESERDAVVAKNDDGSYSAHVDPPVASLASARDRLDAGNEPFVFFNDEDTQRGHVLYRRVDGHYGLIVPADD